ncbi:translocation sec66 [Pyrrhoderma noxium]|uniref:Translocation sec66 n=1 Tax=Pyrrhoderma noxium TaxID=2282107 RepID=A0A286UWY5_9AGAM|nr:translocation sec66 [Pyrrhoderma noxium]
MATSIWAPVLYLVIVVGGLGVFSSLYRKRRARKEIEPYFPPHAERNAYVTLLQMSDPPTPDSLLKSALIQRACEDVRRVIRIRDDKPAMQNLLQKGVVGDDLWTALLAAEKELEAEILEVIHEANSFMMGWGQFIFSTAGEMVHNEKVLKWMQDYPKLRSEAETKYGGKKKLTVTGSSASSSSATSPTSTTPAVKIESAPPQVKEEQSQSAPSITSDKSRPATPSLVPTKNGALAPPNAVDAESVTSMSDGELVSAPSSPSKTPKKSGKKGKKRK